MTTKFEVDVAAAYKALDERVEVICAVATRLLDAMDFAAVRTHNMTEQDYRAVTNEIRRLQAELREAMK